MTRKRRSPRLSTARASYRRHHRRRRENCRDGLALSVQVDHKCLLFVSYPTYRSDSSLTYLAFPRSQVIERATFSALLKHLLHVFSFEKTSPSPVFDNYTAIDKHFQLPVFQSISFSSCGVSQLYLLQIRVFRGPHGRTRIARRPDSRSQCLTSIRVRSVGWSFVYLSVYTPAADLTYIA